MSDLDDFLKAVSEAKQKDPISEKVKQVKTNIKEDLGDLFSQISVIREQDPVQQKNKKIEKQVQESVKMDLGTLFSQLSSLKNDLEEELVVAEAKLVEVKSEDILTEVSPIPALPKIRTPEQRIKDTNADVDKYLTGKTFQQPDPDLVSKDVEAIRTKIKFLEQAIGRIAAAGPGGGEVNLRYLDDVDRSTIANNRFLTYDEASKKFKFIAIAQEDGVQSDWNQANNEARDFIKNKPTIPSAQIQSDWNQANNTSLDFIKNKPTIPDVSGIQDAISASGEPMGHEDKTQSVISFNAATRTFTIAPVAGSFEVWVRGTKQIYTTAQTVTIPNTSGIYYIYFDSNGIGTQTNYFIWDTQAPTSLVYYNAVTGLAPYFADERHGTTLDWQTHEYLHRTRGAVIANGFSIGSYTVGGAVQIDIGNGTFFDEDLQIDVVHSNTPTANTWEQDLQGPAQIPMFYLSGTGWVRDNPTGYVNKAGTSRPRYNLLSGSTWSVADIDNNKFGATFIVATNNLTYPIIGIMSQSSHANQGDAEGLEFSDLILTGFPVAEFRLLYKVVFKANSLHGILTSVWDLRQLSATTPSAAIGSDHGLLSGLGDDDHPQYLLRTDAAIAAITSGTINGATIGATTPSTGSFTSLTTSSDATINGITIGKGIGSVNQDNVKIGNNVLTNNTTGEGILAVGSNSMAANTTGKWIAAFGGGALNKNTTGIINCAFGSSSLGENTTGSNNTGFGDSALRSNISGGNSVGIGFDAGRFISTGSGLSNINQSIFIGNSTKSLANSETNTIVIGYNAVGLGSNTTVIGNSSTTATKLFGTLEATGDATINGAKFGLGSGNYTTNLAIGADALTGSNTGQFNLAVGAQTLTANTTGQQNLALGQGTLYFNTTGSYNLAVGTGALQYNTVGSYNTGLGRYSLIKNVDGLSNTAVGHEAGHHFGASGSSEISRVDDSIFIGADTRALSNLNVNTIVIGKAAVGLGSNSTVIGNSSTTQTKLFGTLEATGDAYFNQSVRVGNGYGNRVFNTVVGYECLSSTSLTGSDNSAFGHNALKVNTTGHDNMGFGSSALLANTTGSYNVAVGRAALYTNIGGNYNVGIGSFTLGNVNGNENTAIGNNTMASNTSGGNNAAIGARALVSNTSGNENTAIGHSALEYNTVGIRNVAVGTYALRNNTASHNVGIGFDTLSGSLMSSQTTQNVGIGTNTLNNIKSTAAIVQLAGDLGSSLFTPEEVSNVQLTYSSGPQVEAGGTYPIVNLSIYDDGDGGFYLAQIIIVNGGSKFTDAGTYLQANLTSPAGQILNYLFYVYEINAGSGNTAIGYSAGSSSRVGSDCVYIGRNANPSSLSPLTRTNEIVIGANAVGAGTNTARIGDSSTTLYVGNLNTSGIGASSISVTNSIYAANQLFETSPSANFNLYGTSTGASTISFSQTSGTLTIGGISSSTSAGTITVGRATGTSTVNIGTGVPATSRTKTINIGTSATTPSGTTLINIGANALTTTTIRGPAVTLAPLGTASVGTQSFSSPQLTLQSSKYRNGSTFTTGYRMQSLFDPGTNTETLLFDSPDNNDRGNLIRFALQNTYLQVLNINDAMGIQYGATYGTGYMGLVSTGTGMPSGANTSRYLYGMHAASFAQGSIIPANGNSPNFRNILDNGSGNLICGSLNTGLGGTSTITATNFLQINHTTPSTSTTSGALQVAGGAGIAGNLNVGGKLTVTSTGVPTAYNSAGTTGTITWDANYIYVCVATNTWKRSAITTW